MWVKHSFIFTVTLNSHDSCKRAEANDAMINTHLDVYSQYHVWS